MRSAADLVTFGLQAEQFNISIADNTAATLCVIPVGKKCFGVVLVDAVIDSGNTVESLNWSVATGSVVVTPQVTNSKSGKASFLVLFKK